MTMPFTTQLLSHRSLKEEEQIISIHCICMHAKQRAYNLCIFLCASRLFIALESARGCREKEKYLEEIALITEMLINL